MADAHVEEHTSLIKTPKQLIVVVLLSFLVPVLGIVMLVHLITGGMKINPNSAAMSEEAVARRLKPVGEVVIAEGGATAAPAATAAASPAAPPPSGGAAAAAPAATKVAAGAGEKIYTSVCTVCHGAGLAGAPKTGDKAAWKPRIAQGRETLYNHAINGIRAMPAKGGAVSTPDAEIKAAVDYMVSKSQ